jgi:hypothetical protein
LGDDDESTFRSIAIVVNPKLMGSPVHSHGSGLGFVNQGVPWRQQTRRFKRQYLVDGFFVIGIIKRVAAPDFEQVPLMGPTVLIYDQVAECQMVTTR